MIRIILLAAFCVIGASVVFGRNSAGIKAGRKLLFLVIFGCGCLAIVFPGQVTVVANLVGVGRGADLLLYIVTMVLLTSLLHSYREHKRTEKREATLVKALALLEMQVKELSSSATPQTPRRSGPHSSL